MPPMTTVERSARANEVKTANGRRRRFGRLADEMKAHPESLDETAQRALAEALWDLGWNVHFD